MIRLRWLYCCVLAVVSIVLAGTEVSAQQHTGNGASPNPKDVSVLYATNTDAIYGYESETERELHGPIVMGFVEFLEQHFSKVGIFDGNKHLFSTDIEMESKEYDVVIVDWKRLIPESEILDLRSSLMGSDLDSELDRARIKGTQAAFSFPKEFSKPMVLMGKSSLLVNPHEELQLGANASRYMPWKASFTGNHAYGTDTTHPIFQGPLAVQIEWVDIEKPIPFFLYPGTRNFNEVLRAWKIQEPHGSLIQRGVSCPRGYFAESEDAEAITCGTDVAPEAVLIGRHGNRLFWGFSADPYEMTAAGQATFVNAICDMKKFDGKLPGHFHETKDPRHEFLESIYLMRASTNKYASAHEKEVQRIFAYTWEYLRSEEPIYFAKLFQKKGQEYTERRMKTLPRDVAGQFDGDIEKLVAYYTDNYEYLHLDPRQRYVVDEEAKSLGMPNRSPDFLKRCIDLLGSNKDAEVALLLLKRYVGKIAETPDQWRAWYESEGKTWSFRESTTKFHSPTKTVVE